MRILTVILFLSKGTFANNYFVSSAGSDGNAGTSTGTSWQTIAKVKSYSLSPGFSAGDTIFLNRGDVWNDSLRFYSSGTVGNPIVISAYGTGFNPEITGFKELSMVGQGDNIWSNTATQSVSKQNTVLINGSLGIKARYPNANVFTHVTSTTGYLLIPHTATDYTGSEIAINTATWELNITKVASHHTGVTNDTLFYTVPTTYGGTSRGGTGYFFQNRSAFVDTTKEWSFDSTTKLMSVFSAIEPTVYYSSIDTLVKIVSKSYVEFRNITFTGANTHTFYLQNVKGITLDSYEIKNVGDAVYMLNSNSVSFKNGSILNSLNNAISSAYDTSLVISGNTIDGIGLYPGMGRSQLDGFNSPYIGYTGYSAIFNRGDNFIFKENTIKNVGYVPVFFYGRYGLVTRNFIENYCTTKSDGGGIYTYLSGNNNGDSGTVVRKNIIKSVATNPKGVITIIRGGIYLDQYTRDVLIDSNSISNVYVDIYAKGKNNVISENLLYDTICQYNYLCVPEVAGTYNSFLNNIVYNRNKVPVISIYHAPVVSFSGFYDSTAEVIDYNRYFYFQNLNHIYMFGFTPYSQAAFKSKAPTYDVHSTYSIPVTGLGDTARYVYNNTLSDSVYTIPGDYVDHLGNIYHGIVPIKSFQSKLLFRSSIVQIRARRIGNLLFN